MFLLDTDHLPDNHAYDVVMPITSIHIPNHGTDGQKFNQLDLRHGKILTNPGIGVQVKTNFDLAGTPVRFEGGLYRNSYRKPTMYAGLVYQPLNLELATNMRASFGAIVAVVTGYKDHTPKSMHMGSFVPMIAARLSIDGKQMATDLTIIPAVPGPKGATAIAVAMRFRI